MRAACMGKGLLVLMIHALLLHLLFQSPIVTQFFPSVLLWAFTVIMPLLVYFSAFLEAHWTR